MEKDRVIHSFAVANKMIEIGRDFNLSEEELKELFILGYNHDIGYKFCADNKEHNIIGGNLLKNSGYREFSKIKVTLFIFIL